MDLSREFRELIDAMLNPDPLLRPSYSELICSQWMASGVADANDVRQDLAERKAMRDGKPVDIPNISNRRSARNAVKRSGRVGNNIYVIGELTAEQRAAQNVISLVLNNHDPSHKIPGCTYIYANMSAPDLFNWLNDFIENKEGIDNQEVDSRVWRITYKIEQERQPDLGDMDEDLMELLGEVE